MTRVRNRLGIGAAGIVLVVAVGLMIRDFASGLPVGPDAAWQTLMSSHRWPPAVSVARLMAWAGNDPGFWIVTGAVLIALVVLRRWRTAIATLLAVELGSVASSTIKQLTARPRPGAALDALTSPAFPSGHTTWAAALAVSLALALPRVWSWVLAASWIAVMAWSRTYLGVHWLSDVAAGALLGVSTALLAAALLEMLAPETSRSRPPATLRE